MRQEILDMLRDSRGEYVSGEVLGEKFMVSRTAVWKHISSLRGQGYVIKGYQNLGYRLDAVPDLLLPAEIGLCLKSNFIGKKIYYYDKTESTNDVALDLSARDNKEGTIVIAEKQTKGKGRMGRGWYSPYAKGIYLSILLRPKGVPPLYSPIFTMLSALAVADTIESFTSIVPSIKWPNDVLIDGRKVSGILVQMRADPDNIDSLVIGIGVNLNQKEKDFPDVLASKATSLRACTGESVDRIKFLCHLLETLENYYLVVRDENDYQLIKDRWLRLSGIMGKEVVIRSAKEMIEGKVIEVGLSGNLEVKCRDGTVKDVFSGEIVSIGD